MLREVAGGAFFKGGANSAACAARALRAAHKTRSRFRRATTLPTNTATTTTTPRHRSGKTSLLFHLSCQVAARGRRAVWLCSQAKLEQSPPALPPGLHRTAPLLSLISFK